MPVGLLHVLTGVDEGVARRLEIRVLDQTELVAGVTTRVLEERDFEAGELVEVSRNFFVQAPDGTVVTSAGRGRPLRWRRGRHPAQWRADGVT
jgi:hypothetical protein